jgi:RHS repeat-associated protein
MTQMGYYYTRDHLGSVRELVNSSGTILTRYSYDPYGRTTPTYTSANTSTPPVGATFQFTGDYFHSASGLSLTKFRAYDPNTARWLNRDPFENAEKSQGPNLYEYVFDNPVDWIDSQGLCCQKDFDAQKEVLNADYNKGVAALTASGDLVKGETSCKDSSDLIFDGYLNNGDHPCWTCKIVAGSMWSHTSYYYRTGSQRDHQWIECTGQVDGKSPTTIIFDWWSWMGRNIPFWNHTMYNHPEPRDF